MDLAIPAGRITAVVGSNGAGKSTLIKVLCRFYDPDLGSVAELSAGEWQRISLARAFLRHAPILVLDEPTSAMDPWAEADWLRRFRRLAASRTAVVITHRFTTAMIADTIYVMA